jgi:hypothetical protein
VSGTDVGSDRGRDRTGERRRRSNGARADA